MEVKKKYNSQLEMNKDIYSMKNLGWVVVKKEAHLDKYDVTYKNHNKDYEPLPLRSFMNAI